LFSGLPAYLGGIFIEDNPGSTYARAVATKKGWKFTGDAESVVLTTAAQEVRITTSSKAMTIDWGDGKIDSYTSTKETKISHAYADKDSYTIWMTVDSLTLLWCYNNQLTALDVSRNKVLTELLCFRNQLTTLDVRLNTALKELDCNNNQLTALDVSKNTALTKLICLGNELRALDVSLNAALTVLDCTANKLPALDVSKNTALTHLECNYNQLMTEALNALFSGLHANGGYISNPRSSTCDQSIATEKGWKFVETEY
jgi:hypothetical protein